MHGLLPKRIQDDWGSGEFAAPRGKFKSGPNKGKPRYHLGIDYLCFPDTEILSPIDGKVTKLGYPYEDDPSYRYVHIRDADGNAHRVFYVDPGVRVGTIVELGDYIGESQDVAKRYYNPYEHLKSKPRKKFLKVMLNHIHYEILDKQRQPIDPEVFQYSV